MVGRGEAPVVGGLGLPSVTASVAAADKPAAPLVVAKVMQQSSRTSVRVEWSAVATAPLPAMRAGSWCAAIHAPRSNAAASPAPAPAASPPPQVTIINNYYGATPMSAARARDGGSTSIFHCRAVATMRAGLARWSSPYKRLPTMVRKPW